VAKKKARSPHAKNFIEELFQLTFYFLYFFCVFYFYLKLTVDQHNDARCVGLVDSGVDVVEDAFNCACIAVSLLEASQIE